MNSIIKRPKWKTVEYSRTKIINAGKTIRKENVSDAEMDEAIQIVDNWRAAHAYPLHVIYMNLRRMAANRDGIIVAERLKRLDSILGKLKREGNMSLWTMQDLGGCRFIVPTVDDVYKYSSMFEKSRIRHTLKNTYDYLQTPKTSGYRSLHAVYEYHSDTNDTYNKNMLIEIQFRTHLQHVWATAVETMGLFTKQAIKSGQGSDEVKRFFALTSSLFAIQEGLPPVPGTSSTVDELINEIRDINAKYRYLDFLSGINVAVNAQEKDKGVGIRPSYYILVLNYTTRRLTIRRYMSSQIEEANAAYNAIEKTRAESKIDAVLVRVSSFATLKSAYPNYFSDIGEFVSLVNSYLD